MWGRVGVAGWRGGSSSVGKGGSDRLEGWGCQNGKGVVVWVFGLGVYVCM